MTRLSFDDPQPDESSLGFLASWDESIVEGRTLQLFPCNESLKTESLPGDVFITNDPYSVESAISHLNDFLVIMPVYHGGKLVGWAANLGHFTDIGSVVPGSMPSD